ncbi:MAG TPA: hypothetical protein VFB21_05340 [Chthonomonadaceae bacterium]|nr:hypothetical protein [Chthonomonadaceae bacterium]
MEETLTETGIVAVVLARMRSRRLPGKPLLPLGEAPVLEQVTRRVRASRFGKNLVVATSNEPSDAPLRDFCAARDLYCFAGSADNVLERMIQAARMFEANLVIRCTLNNVLLDPQMLEACVVYARRSGMDYVTVGRLPVGAAVEAMPLRTLNRLAAYPFDAPIQDFRAALCAHAEAFDPAVLPSPPRLCRPDLSLALETEADYRFLSRLYAEVPARANGLIHLEDAIAYAGKTQDEASPLRFAA